MFSPANSDAAIEMIAVSDSIVLFFTADGVVSNYIVVYVCNYFLFEYYFLHFSLHLFN